MKLIDLNPQWIRYGGEGIRDKDGNPVPERQGIGLNYDCPCGCDSRCFVAFANPLDGGPPIMDARHVWERTGETFESLTLTPSILRSPEKGGCGWHGFITNGEIRAP